MIQDLRNFYINGQWVEPLKAQDLAVENPATEESLATISLGAAGDVDLAVAAAKAAFPIYSQYSVEQRIVLMEKLLEVYMGRYDEMAAAISMEMGAPISFATAAQADCGRGHISTALEALITGMKLGKVESLHIADDPLALKDTITEALPAHDILIFTGGISKGKYDYVAPVLTELLGSPHFHGIAQRPGKPMAFWTHKPNNDPTTRADDGAAEGREECKRLIFAHPGNPVSVMACAARYLIPSLVEILSGRSPTPQQNPATGSFHCPSHFTGLVPCRINNGRIQLVPPSNSGNFLALAATDGIAQLPGELTGKELLNEPASFYPWA